MQYSSLPWKQKSIERGILSYKSLKASRVICSGRVFHSGVTWIETGRKAKEKKSSIVVFRVFKVVFGPCWIGGKDSPIKMTLVLVADADE